MNKLGLKVLLFALIGVIGLPGMAAPTPRLELATSMGSANKPVTPATSSFSTNYQTKVDCVEMSKKLNELAKKPPAIAQKVSYMSQLKLTYPATNGTVQVEQTCYLLSP